MGEALALAYIELQKTHVRDWIANGGFDNRMNAIVLFTDGVPSSVATYLNKNGSSVVRSGSASNCTYWQDTATPSHPMYGYITQGSNTGGTPPYTSACKHRSQYQFPHLCLVHEQPRRGLRCT